MNGKVNEVTKKQKQMPRMNKIEDEKLIENNMKDWKGGRKMLKIGRV